MAGLDFSNAVKVTDDETENDNTTPTVPVEEQTDTATPPDQQQPADTTTPQAGNPFANAVRVEPTPEPATDPNVPEADALSVSDAGTDQAEPVELAQTPFAVLDRAYDDGLLGSADFTLPDPDMTMYRDIEREGTLGQTGFETAMRRFQMYANHPDSERGILGDVIYNGKVVPIPGTAMIFGNYNPALSSKVAYGLRNMTRNVLEFGASVVDAGDDFLNERFNMGGIQLFDEEGNIDLEYISGDEWARLSEENPDFASLTAAVQEGIAKVEPGDSLTDTLIMEGTGMIAPGVAAVRMVSWAPKIAKFLAFEAGVAAGASSDAGGLLIGENAMFEGAQEVLPILRGIEYEPDDPRYARVIANRTNILMEAMAIGGIAEKTLQGISWGSRFAWSITGAPLLNIARPTAREDALAREVLDQLTGVTDDPESMQAAREGIIKLIEENKEVFAEMPDGLADDIQFTTDTMSAVERALANGDTDAARELILRAQRVRRGALGEGLPQTTNATARPGREVERVTAEAEESLGGTGAINESSEGFAQQGLDEIGAADDAVGRAQTAIDDLDENLTILMQEDAGLISQVTELERKVGFDITTGANQAADSLRDNLAEASRVMDLRKNELFNNVQGGAVDIDGMITTLQSLRPGQLDIAASAMPGDQMFGQLLDQVKLRRTPQEDGSILVETEEQMRQRVANWARRNELDFATLFTDIRVSLADSIGRMTGPNASAAERGAAQTLINFKRWIDEDAVEYLREVGDEDVVEAAEEAMDYFRNDWAPYWDDGTVLEDIGRLRRETVGRGMQGPRFMDESRNAITDTINNRNRETVGNMIDLLQRPEAGENAPLVVDYIVGDTLSRIAGRVDDVSRLREIDISDIRTSLSDYAAILRNNFPEQAQRLDGLVERLRVARGDRVQLEAELRAAQEAAEQARERIYNNELKTFFQREGVENINGYESFAQLFRNRQAGRVNPDGTFEGPLADLFERAMQSDNPILKEGLQAAFSRYTRETFLTATRESGGNRMVSMAALNASENEVNNLLQYGQIVFQDKPEFIAGLRTALAEAGLVQRGRNAKAFGVGSQTAETQAAMQAVDRTVTMTFGVLSRTGAKIRALASGAIRRRIDPEMNAKVLDAMLSDPDYFIEVARRVTNADGAVNPEGARYLRAWLVRSGIYSEDNEPSEEDFFLQLAQAEMDYRRAMESLESQSEEVFGQ